MDACAREPQPLRRQRRQAVEPGGVVVQHHPRDLHGAFTGDVAVAHHRRQCHRQRTAAGGVGVPGHLFPPLRRPVRPRVRPEQHLVWPLLQPAAQRPGQRVRGAEKGLVAEVGIHVGLADQVADVFRPWPAAVDDHPPGVRERRVVQPRLQQQRFGFGEAVVAAYPAQHVDVHRQVQPPRLARHVAEEKVLQRRIIRRGRIAAAGPAVVHRRRLGLRGVAERQRAQVRDLEFQRHRAAAGHALERRRHHARQVFRERGRDPLGARLAQVPAQQLFLARVEAAVVRAHALATRVGERKEERVRERHPAEAAGRQPGSHRHAVGQHGLDVQPVQHPAGVRGPARRDLPRARRLHRRERRRVRTGGGNAEQVAPGAGPRVAGGRPADREGEGRHGVGGKRVVLAVRRQAGERRAHRVRVVVDRRDALDRGHQRAVHRRLRACGAGRQERRGGEAEGASHGEGAGSV